MRRGRVRTGARRGRAAVPVVLAALLAAACTTSGEPPPPSSSESAAERRAADRAAALADELVAGLTPSGPLTRGVTAAAYSYPDAVRERVQVRTGLDRDGDGERDLVTLDVVRPRETQDGLRVPVVLEASPYYADVGRGPQAQRKTTLDDGRPGTFPLVYDNLLVPRGYAVALLDLPGTSASGGCLDYGGPGDVDAAVAAVGWLTGRGEALDADGAPVRAGWSTGAVGIVGKSYDGYLANAVAARGVPGLKTAVAIAAPSSIYDYLTRGGVRVGRDFLVGFVDDRTRRPDGACAAQRARLDAGEDDTTALPSPFWAERDVVGRAGDVRAAVLLAHGVGDRNVLPDQAARWWTALGAAGVPRRLWLLQGGHVDPFDVRRDVWLDLLHRWFDHWLMGVENGIGPGPVVTVEQPGGGWTDGAAWPDPAARPVPLDLPDEPVGPLRGRAPGDPDDLLARFLPTRSDVPPPDDARVVVGHAGAVLLSGPPLRTAVRLSGPVRVTARVVPPADEAALFGALVELGPATRPDLTVGTEGLAVDETGTPTCVGEPGPDDDGCFLPLRPVTVATGAGRLTAGWQRLGLGADGVLRAPAPGVPVDVTWELPPVEALVPAGRRLALVLAVARPLPDPEDGPRPPAVEVDVRSVGTVLPVVGGAPALAGS